MDKRYKNLLNFKNHDVNCNVKKKFYLLPGACTCISPLCSLTENWKHVIIKLESTVPETTILQHNF